MKAPSKFAKAKVVLFLLGIFVVTVGFLIATPKAVRLVDSKISSYNQISDPVTPKEVKELTVVDSKIPPPPFTSAAVLAQDLDTDSLLFEKNSHTRLYPASTTKIMTALVAQEHFNPSDILIVPPQAMVGGSTMGLTPGEKLTFRSLLFGMLLNSGNDAAYTISYNYPGGYDAFIDRMNKKTLELGLSNTHFQNPAGFDSPGHYSSAYDLAVIAKRAQSVPLLSKIFATRETSVLSYDNRSHILRNLNKLLSENGVMGIKTGFTQDAGENLVGLVERDNRKVLTVVLNSKDRFRETKELMDWVFKNYSWTFQ